MAQKLSVHVAPQRSFVHAVGLEQEGWAPWISSKGLPALEGGSFTDDAGHHLCELVTAVQPSLSASFDVLQRMSDQYPTIQFTPFRPPQLARAAGIWHEQVRYRQILAALRQESPQHWQIANRMTDQAAFQVNVSGDIDPLGNDGVFLINVFNDLAPFIVAQIHRDIGLGVGHLQIWQKFARAERLPQAGRWFADGAAMVRYIEQTPRLIKETMPGSDDYIVLPGELQRVTCSLDLGVVWWFVRVKQSVPGKYYLEFRYLPSMPLAQAAYYAAQLLAMIETLLTWFHGHNRGRSVTCRDMAWQAYLQLGQDFPGYVPNRFLTPAEWRELLSC